jgi:hypothetical protein
MTKLEGVNRILRAAKEHPVASLGQATENDSLMAEQLLDEVNRREQMTSLHVNTIETTFTPDENDDYKVVLPAETLQVFASSTDSDENWGHRTVSGEVLLVDYSPPEDEDGLSFENFTEVNVRITTLMEFEDLPLHHQFSVTDQAAQEYQMAVLGSNTLDQALQQRAMRSRAIARAYDMRMRPANQFANSRSTGAHRATRWTPRGWYV